jgi:hypothetical protein
MTFRMPPRSEPSGRALNGESTKKDHTSPAPGIAALVHPASVGA